MGLSECYMSLPNLIWSMPSNVPEMSSRCQVATPRNGSMILFASNVEEPQGRSVVSQSGRKRTVLEYRQQLLSHPLSPLDNRRDKFKISTFQTLEAILLSEESRHQWHVAEVGEGTAPTEQRLLSSLRRKLARYVRDGRYQKTLAHFQKMQNEGVKLDRHTFIPVIKACAGLQSLNKARQIHMQVLQCGYESDLLVCSSLINMYAKCGSIVDAQTVFNRMPLRDVVAWNAMILAHVKCGQGQKALQLFQQMEMEQVELVTFTFVGVLNACASLRALDEGRRIHSQISQSGCESNIFVANSLVDMYAKCGSIVDAQKVFSKMPKRDLVSWTAMLNGFVKCGEGEKALELYNEMQLKNMRPGPVTFVGVLNACASVGALEEGRSVHAQIVQWGCESDLHVGTSLVDMYAKCGSIEDAEKVFNTLRARNVVSWNAMILGYVRCGQGQKALQLYGQMEGDGVQPVPLTFVGALNACASVGAGALQEGKHVHARAVQRGCELNPFVTTSLIDMYAKCGCINDAQRLFNRMHTRNVVVWNAMIQSLVKCGQGQKALGLYGEMQAEQVVPDVLTFVWVLSACANVGALEEGKRVHAQIIQRDFEAHLVVGSNLVDMYAKCGNIEDAGRMFDRMPVRDTVSWNVMLKGYALNGCGKEAILLFKRMVNEGVKVDKVTFIALLSACSHSGLVEDGLHYFESMSSVYGVSATVEHYACMVDILGRAGRLHDAEDVIKTMPCEPDVAVWMALLGACRVHGNIEIGESAAKRVVEMDPTNAAGYVLLSNIYAAAGKWDSSKSVQLQRVGKAVKKYPGCSWIEVNNKVHSFIVDDQIHPQIAQIHAELKRLSDQLKEAGHVPDTRFVLHDVVEEEKVSRLCYHSEKLAVVFGLISTPSGSPLRIIKNLRVCGDCHTVMKNIAKISGREIIVRDANRFHHFRNGFCTCKDYW